MTPERMAEIHAAAFRAQRPWSRQEFEALLAQPTTLLECSGNSGFALARTGAGEAELLTIAVHPENQGQGVGKTCLEALIKSAQSLGIERLFLEVEEENTAALRLYEGAGLQQTGRRKGYYRRSDGTRSDAILMVKTLPKSTSNP